MTIFELIKKPPEPSCVFCGAIRDIMIKAIDDHGNSPYICIVCAGEISLRVKEAREE